MLNKIIDNSDLDKYRTTYDTGHVIFLEGDDTQDLYILTSGDVDVFKGNKSMAEITEPGSLFGEMSFLLGAKRTATVKARNQVKAICIPKEEITTFLSESPTAARIITKLLAERLDETSQILYGLKEFCDQLPDAVILSDTDEKILTWNSAAEKLYGRNGHQMRYTPVENIYEEPQVYKNFLGEVQSGNAVKEKILRIRHPEKGIRFISTSMTLLYDDHRNFQGIISLGRDITAVTNLERGYRRARYWLARSFFLLGILAFLGGSIFFGYPHFSKGHQNLDGKKLELRNRLAKDYHLLKSTLVKHFLEGDRSKTRQLMKNFFDSNGTPQLPYTGLILLDKEKRVFDTYSIKGNRDPRGIVGSTYAGIDFRGSEKSLHKVLTLYRTDKKHPMGYKGMEVAFEMNRDGEFLGWLVFQMNVDLLEKKHGVFEVDLRTFQYKRP